MSRVVIIVALVGACADPTRSYTLELPFEPMLLEYRSGSGAWHTPHGSFASPPDASTTFEVAVDDDYELVVVCPGTLGVVTFELFATREETPSVSELDCGAIPVANISGEMQQAGQVFTRLSDAIGSTAPWSYSGATTDGPNDLVAIDATASRIAVRHDQVVTDSFAEPAIDLATEGDATASWLPTFTDPPAETDLATISTYLITKNSTVAQLATHALELPATQVVDGDLQRLQIEDPMAGQVLEIDNYFEHTPQRVFTLPTPIEGVTFDPTSASWSSSGPFTRAYFVVGDLAGYQEAYASADWLEGHGPTSLAFDGDAPGLDPAWSVTMPTERLLELDNVVSSYGPDYVVYATTALDPTLESTTARRRSRAQLRR
ncbi:MAG TPA: hypothetical protein VMJ10_20380 [Kofleriaceae bacterium]|nr:hypothetical protein [Kofleriaceae bacterium]